MNTGTMSKTIDNVANEYRNNVEVDAVLLWDAMKMQIRSSSLKYAKEKKAKIKSKEKTLESDISSLRKQLEEGNLSDTAKSDICKELDIKTLQFEKISQYHTRGAILRSKARWYNEGEKNSKYFLNLQKRHFNTKTIKQLKLDDNSVINTDDNILKEAKAFYQRLYTTSKEQNTPDHADIFFPEGFTEILDEQSQKECEGLLTDAECLESLKIMAPNKSPGTDGLPAEFYIIIFSVHERAVFYKSCDLIGSGSGRYSPIRPAHSRRYPMRDESSITSLTSLQFFINYKDTYHVNL